MPGVRLTEPDRNRERSFCCGAGGARMWLDETIGTRINEARTDELLATGPDVVAAACPYCIDMLGDGVALRRQQDRVGDHVVVTDVAEVLLRSVREPAGTAPEPAGTAPEPAGTAPEPAGTAPEPAGIAPEPGKAKS